MLRVLPAWGIVAIWGTLLPVTSFGAETVNQKIVVGIIEPIAIGASGIVIDAKLDTGADTCSLNAQNIEMFDRDGGKWVRFDVVSAKGRRDTLEAPFVRTVRIKRGESSGPPRPVVRLSVCLGNVQREVEVNLANRRRYAYPALVGRNFLAGYVLVDSARKQMTHPDCPAAPSR